MPLPGAPVSTGRRRGREPPWPERSFCTICGCEPPFPPPLPAGPVPVQSGEGGGGGGAGKPRRCCMTLRRPPPQAGLCEAVPPGAPGDGPCGRPRGWRVGPAEGAGRLRGIQRPGHGQSWEGKGGTSPGLVSWARGCVHVLGPVLGPALLGRSAHMASPLPQHTPASLTAVQRAACSLPVAPQTLQLFPGDAPAPAGRACRAQPRLGPRARLPRAARLAPLLPHPGGRQ